MNTTVLIKTFRRPETLKRLLASIELYYPDLPVIIFDDSYEYSPDGFNLGLSKGRNELVNKCKTKYCVILDDDCVFTADTDLVKIEQEIADKDLDILQFKIEDLEYYGCYETTYDGDTSVVRYTKESKDGIYDFCANIFLAKTETLKKYKWDDDLKLGEHFAYFYEHQGKLRVGVSDIPMAHLHTSNVDYHKYRSRAMDYVEIYLERKRITNLINLDGRSHLPLWQQQKNNQQES